MKLNDSIKSLLFDARLVEWNLKHGKLTPDEVQKYLKSLPDCAANAVPLMDDGSNGKADSFQVSH